MMTRLNDGVHVVVVVNRDDPSPTRLGIAAIVVLTAVAGGLASGFGDLFGGSKHDELVD